MFFLNEEILQKWPSDELWIVSFKFIVKGYQECRFEFTYRGTTQGTREFNQLSFPPQEQCFVIGRFHTRGRTNRLDRQIVSSLNFSRLLLSLSLGRETSEGTER